MECPTRLGQKPSRVAVGDRGLERVRFATGLSWVRLSGRRRLKDAAAAAVRGFNSNDAALAEEGRCRYWFPKLSNVSPGGS